MSERLKGRRVLITGASRGIGLGIADSFVREGADVMLAATNESLLEEVAEPLAVHGTKIAIAVADVSDPEACKALVDRTTSALGGLDVLVNAAGIYIAKPFVEYSYEEFDRMQRVNLYGVFSLMQYVLPGMIAQQYGKIINVASTAGKWGSRNQTPYNVAKHGVVGMTRSVALEVGRNGININAICPGWVQTDLMEDFMSSHAKLAGLTIEAMREACLAKVPIGRFLDVAECGHLAVYLASAESDGMTGQSLLLDGGLLLV
jgi:NAD(P)-dependent dehydrogenase (short-subunit alcohol dehydrogenase family)